MNGAKCTAGTIVEYNIDVVCLVGRNSAVKNGEVEETCCIFICNGSGGEISSMLIKLEFVLITMIELLILESLAHATSERLEDRNLRMNFDGGSSKAIKLIEKIKKAAKIKSKNVATTMFVFENAILFSD